VARIGWDAAALDLAKDAELQVAAVNVVDCRQPRLWALAAYGLALRGWPSCSGPCGPPSTADYGGECQARDDYLSHRSLLSVSFLAGMGQRLPIRLPRSSRRVALCQERLHRAR